MQCRPLRPQKDARQRHALGCRWGTPGPTKTRTDKDPTFVSQWRSGGGWGLPRLRRLRASGLNINFWGQT